jgi:TPR repeat protein
MIKPFISESFKLTLSLLLLILPLTACQVYKDGGAQLVQGDQIIAQNNNLDAAAIAYQKALKSTYPEIRAQAAYNLALIAREKGQTVQYRNYLEQASADGNIDARLKLAQILMETKRDDEKARQYLLPIKDLSAGANVNLMQLYKSHGHHQTAAKYARQAERILLSQLSSAPDIDGNKALQLARLYAENRQYFTLPKNPEPWFRKSIASGNERAATELATYWATYKTRANTDADVFALMIQAANAGNMDAVKHVASAYETGKGVARDPVKAAFWNSKIPASSKKSSSSSSFSLTAAYANIAGGSLNAAIPSLKEAAAKGSLEAMVLLDTLSPDTRPSHDYSKHAPEAIHAAVRKLERKFGNKYPDMAERQYILAANAGSGGAAYKIAQKLEKSDPAKVAEWYKKAAEKGEPKAMLILARQAKIGQGRSRSEEEAARWFEKAAEAGNAEAQYEIGMAYANGSGVKKNKEKAYQWLEKSSASGYTLASEAVKALKK